MDAKATKEENELQDSIERLNLMEERIEDAMPWVNGYFHPIQHRDINTREEWLEAACAIMKPWVDAAVVREQEVREIRDKNNIKVVIELINPPNGFDVAVAPIEKKMRGCLGVCRHASHHGGRARIQINPSMCGDKDTNEWNVDHEWHNDAVYLVHVVLHEMVHAYTEGHGHRGYFSAIMKRLNSIGKMTASLPGELQAHLIESRVLPFLPDYTDLHVPFSITERGKRKVGSRLIKIVTDCGLILRASSKVCLEIENGHPCCPACGDYECGLNIEW